MTNRTLIQHDELAGTGLRVALPTGFCTAG